MRLTSVVLHASDLIEDVEFSLREAKIPSRYIVRQILGIDAEEITPKFYGTGQSSGTKFYDLAMKPKEIVMRVGLNPNFHVNETISEVRDKLYRLISATRNGQIQLRWMSGASLVAGITGMVTKFEVPYFTALPELQITFYCPDPLFRSVHPITYEVADLPTTNPVILSDNASTAPHGLSFKVKFTATASDFTIQDDPVDPDWGFTVTPDGGFDVDDELWFSSEYGNKQVYLFNLTTPHHLMDKIDDTSIWPIIFPGANTFHFTAIGDFDWLELSYHSAYWGV